MEPECKYVTGHHEINQNIIKILKYLIIYELYVLYLLFLLLFQNTKQKNYEYYNKIFCTHLLSCLVQEPIFLNNPSVKRDLIVYLHYIQGILGVILNENSFC